jgi:hypothetical protein
VPYIIPVCFFAVTMMAGMGAPGAGEADETPLESYVCLAEGLMVASAKASIANPGARADFSVPGLERDGFTAADGRTIRGLFWKAERAEGYVLVVQGTSMLAAEIHERFRGLAELGLDVYLYDFRGYGMSDGETALRGIISDYGRAIRRLNADPRYRHRFLYGLSFGGIVLLNAVRGDHGLYDGMVFDSVPDGIPWYVFCDPDYDPDRLMPAAETGCGNWLVIAGGSDGVVGGRAVDFARDAEARCGGVALARDDYGHVFMDNAVNTAERLGAARRFLADLMAGDGGTR